MSHTDQLKTLREQVSTSDKIHVGQLRIVFGASSVPIPDSFPTGVRQFYQKLNGFVLNWKPIGSPSLTAEVTGCVKILPLHEVVRDWKEVLWFSHTKPNDSIRKFKILDFFIDEACVGFYEKESTEDHSLYFYDFQGKPVNLYLDMDGYIQMLCAARGFRCWQQAIVAFIEKRENSESQIFQENMPRLFPDFNIEQFKLLYRSIQLPQNLKR